MSIIQKIYDLFHKNDTDDDILDFESNIDKLDNSDTYPISQYKAFQIANERQNLKSDYCKNGFRAITYIDFTKCNVDLTTYNEEQYWHVKITGGDVSWLSFEDDEDIDPTFCDGFFIEEDFKKLQCLVNVNTGEYLYFPVTD